VGFQDFAALDIFTASDADEIMRQTVMRFASEAARNAALSGNLEEGMVACTTDTTTFWFYDGSAWVPWWSPWVTFSNLDGGGSGDIDIGTGTFAGVWRYEPGGFHVRWKLIFGSTSALTGDAAFVLPVGVTSRNDSTYSVGSAMYYDSSGDRTWILNAMIPHNSNLVTLYHGGAGNAGVVDQTNPFAFDLSDIMVCDIVVAL
jgi:hypothetical protein